MEDIKNNVAGNIDHFNFQFPLIINYSLRILQNVKIILKA